MTATLKTRPTAGLAVPRKPRPEVPDPKAEPKPSGAAVATARAFSPRRVGWAKTGLAVGIVVANAAFLLSLDKDWIPADGNLAIYAAGLFGLLTGPVVRHLGSRWKA